MFPVDAERRSPVELTTRIQATPEGSIVGNLYTLPKPKELEELRYVIVLADGAPVAQQSFCKLRGQWWVDDLFVAKAHRGTEVIKVLREATFRAVAARAAHFCAFIQHAVATPEKVLGDPVKLSLGLKITERVVQEGVVSKYSYDVSALAPDARAA